MNGITMIFAATLALIVIVASPTQAAPELAASITKETDPQADFVKADPREDFIKGIGATRACYTCTSPCSAYYCCNTTGYPQCCWVPGLGCRCCRY